MYCYVQVFAFSVFMFQFMIIIDVTKFKYSVTIANGPQLPITQGFFKKLRRIVLNIAKI